MNYTSSGGQCSCNCFVIPADNALVIKLCNMSSVRYVNIALYLIQYLCACWSTLRLNYCISPIEFSLNHSLILCIETL